MSLDFEYTKALFRFTYGHSHESREFMSDKREEVDSEKIYSVACEIYIGKSMVPDDKTERPFFMTLGRGASYEEARAKAASQMSSLLQQACMELQQIR